ncbi:MAG: cupredoxin domain-containing protein [Nitrosotalea sp.]
MKSKPIGALFGVLTLVAILAIAPSSAFAQQSQVTVNIAAGDGSGPNCSQTNNCFNPNVVNVAPGTTVEWQNHDTVSHTVTSGNPSDNQTGTIFDSSLIAAGKSFSFTFNNPGTYNYFCQVHPWMTGQVIVGAATTASTTGSSMSGSSSGMNMSSGSNTPSTASAPSTPPPSTASAPSTPINAEMQYTDADNPTGPMQSIGWGLGMVVAGVMAGAGILTIVRKH